MRLNGQTIVAQSAVRSIIDTGNGEVMRAYEPGHLFMQVSRPRRPD
jgi:hypothetical protein